MQYFKVSVGLICLIYANCVNAASFGYGQRYFVKTFENVQNDGSNLISGLQSVSLSQCAAMCTEKINCSTFNFNQSNSDGTDGTTVNCRLFNTSQGNLTYNVCCDQYIASEPAISTVIPQNSEENPVTTEISSSAQTAEIVTSKGTSTNMTLVTTTTVAVTTTTTSSAAALKTFTYAGLIAVIPSVQCNDTDPSHCIVLQATWSDASSFCSSNYKSGKLVVLTFQQINAFIYQVVTNYTLCPPYCDFWIGLTGVGTQSYLPVPSVSFEWGPWVDGSKYSYNSWEPGYPQQTAGHHYAYMNAVNGNWESTTNATSSAFVCAGSPN